MTATLFYLHGDFIIIGHLYLFTLYS